MMSLPCFIRWRRIGGVKFSPVGRCFTFGRDSISRGRDDRECPPPVQEKSAARGHYQGNKETLFLLEAGRTEASQAGFGPKAEPEEGSPGFRIDRQMSSQA